MSDFDVWNDMTDTQRLVSWREACDQLAEARAEVERLRDTDARAQRAVQEIDSFEGARTRWRTRLANPSELYRGADGISDGMDRNRGIGNAVVPQVAEAIGRAIVSAALGLGTGRE